MVLLLLLGQGGAQEFTVVVGRSDHGLGPGFNHQTKLVSNNFIGEGRKVKKWVLTCRQAPSCV